jgi:hypothetical protein
MNGTATLPDPQAVTTINTAEAGTSVGIQASVVHHASVYQISANDPPEKKYATGVRYLEDGVPHKAQELLSAAIADGLDTAEVRFHWMLAMFSKRSDRDLFQDERDRVVEAAERFADYGDDDYGAALEAMRELVDQLFRDSPRSTDLAEKRILALPSRIKRRAVRHLDKVLSSATKEQVWASTKRQAEGDQFANNRLGRVWAYFQADPIPPRHRHAEPPRTPPRQTYRVVAGLLLCVLAVGYLGWLTASSANVGGIIAYVLALASGYVATRDAFEWRYRDNRIRSEELRRLSASAAENARGRGFTAKVSRSFDYYFTKYRPHSIDRDSWLAETAGIRTRLRAEVAESYREQRIPVERVTWLIRYHAIDAQRRWKAGTLDDYRSRFAVPDTTKLRCALSLTVLVLTLAAVVETSVQAAPITAPIATAVALAGGLYSARTGYGICSERRRYRDDSDEVQRQDEGRQEEYRRWKKKLGAIRPREDEMETWLRSDTMMLIDRALRHYRMSWRDVIAYAVLQVPARNANRGRVRGGPWRYDRYGLRLFLITKDGVREVSSELNFRTAEFDGEERNNFRFEAVSSVNVVVKGSSGEHSLRLTLMNGPVRDILVTSAMDLEDDGDDTPVAERPRDEISPGDTNDPLAMSLDASGFLPTLRILEGIAAEGKNWITRGTY